MFVELTSVRGNAPILISTDKVELAHPGEDVAGAIVYLTSGIKVDVKETVAEIKEKFNKPISVPSYYAETGLDDFDELK